MAKVRVFNHSIPEIGYISRTVTQGDEFEMVSRYINYLITVYKRSKCKNAAIFIEPQIDSGYPDIVIVEYTSKLGANWNDFRWDLTNTDLKILYQIQMQKYVSVDELSDLLGFTNDDALRQKTARLWSEMNHVPITKEMINCMGCRTEGVKTPFCDNMCEIRKCSMQKGFVTCGDCPDMESCKTLGMVVGSSPDALANLKSIKEAKEK